MYLSLDQILSYVPLMRNSDACKSFLIKHPDSLQASMISILSDKFDQFSTGSISEYHFICIFQELYSHELNSEQLLQVGEFVLHDIGLGDDQITLVFHFLLADSLLVDQATRCSSPK